MKTHTFHTSTGRRKYRVDIAGQYDGSTEVPERKVSYCLWIRGDLNGRDAITTALLEATHELRPDWTVAQVDALSDEQGRFLWRYLNARDMLK